MRKWTFCKASLVLVSAAVVLHLSALSQCSRGLSRRARAVGELAERKQQAEAEGQSPGSLDKEWQEIWRKTDGYARRAVVLGTIGLGLAASGLVSLVFSFLRREPVSRLWPVALLIIYCMLSLVAV